MLILLTSGLTRGGHSVSSHTGDSGSHSEEALQLRRSNPEMTEILNIKL